MERKKITAMAMTVAAMCAAAPGFGLTAMAKADDSSVVIGSLMESRSLLPWENLSTYDYYITNAVYDCIMYAPGIYEDLEPRVAQSYELSEDGMTLTLHLTDGVKFQNGTEVTAEDVAKSILYHVQSPYYLDMSYIADAKATDDATVVVTCNSFSPSFVWDVCGCKVVCAAAYEEDPDGYALSPVGCGPYTLLSNVAGSGAELEAFADYYRGEASIKNVQVDIVTDPTTLELGIKDGSIDYAQIAESSIASFPEGTDGVVMEYAPSDIFYELLFNCENEYLKEPAVRKAIASAINTDVIVNGLLSGAGDVNSSIPLSSNCYEWNAEAAGSASFDAEAAKAMLEEAGIQTPIDLGKAICRDDAVHQKIMTVIQSNLADIGINVELEVEDAGAAAEDMISGNYDLELMTLSYYDSVFSCASSYDPEMIGSANFSRYTSEELSALFEKGMSTSDLNERQGIANEIMAYLNEEMPGMKLCDKKLPICHADNLEVTLRTDNWMQMYDLKWSE